MTQGAADHPAAAPEADARTRAPRRLSLRAKGGFTLGGLVLYVILAGMVISDSRYKQLGMVEELEHTHRQEELLVQVNMAVARAILTVNENYITPNPADAVQPISLEIGAVQSNLNGLKAELPVLGKNIAELQSSLEHLRGTPSRGDIALLRSSLHELVAVLDGITRAVREKKEKLLAAYRLAQDTVSFETIVFSLLGLTVLGAVTALFFSKLAWDIRNVAARAIDIVQGYRGAPMPVSRGDEVGDLMAALNNMQHELRRHETQLELSRQQHFHKEKMAAVGSLAAQLAHEINNPIAAIAGIAQSIDEVRQNQCCSSSGALCQPELIIEQAKRVALITRQIAEFTAPQSAEPQLLDLNALVRSTLNFISYDRRFKRVGLSTDLDSQLPALHTVGDHISQVLMNLLINSADAMEGVDARKAAITVATRSACDRVRLSVADNGRGMSEEVLGRAFDEFFTTKPAGKGSGLGLSLCKTLVETCGGTIRIESEQDKGTIVTIELPLASEASMAPDPRPCMSS
jgi:two-component system, NtrC family, sensor kinase